MQEKIIQGTFNGETLWGDDTKIYPVNPNYASKSRLVEGDRLQLTIEPNGNFLFKQIDVMPRKKVVGKFDNNNVVAEGKTYKILYSSVTYFKLLRGDEVVLIIPDQGNPMWGALDMVLKKANKNIDKEF